MSGTALTADINLEQPDLDATEVAPVRLGSVIFQHPAHDQSRQLDFSVCSGKFHTTFTENWLVNGLVSSGQYQAIEFRKGADFLIGSTRIHYTDTQSFNKAVTERYHEIFDCIEQQGYKNLIRMWNYIPSIHTVDGIDRYQHFCQARHNAFAERFEDIKTILPAATAVGIEGEWLHIYFIAANASVEFCENSRQVSAYDYPVQYGPKSPSFARASLIGEAPNLLLISGTASVVGHESVHINNVEAQTRETMANISVLLEDTDKQHDTAFGDFASLLNVKIYIRHNEDRLRVASVLDEILPAKVERIFIVADICREELLVEIEAIAQQPGATKK